METIKKLKEIKKFLKEKNDYWWNEERKDLDLKYYVPTDIICEELEQYEIGIPKDIYDFLGGEKMYDGWYNGSVASYLEGHCLENFRGDNTYNHSGRPQNDFNWQTFKIEKDKYWVVLMFHIGGDIRGNYTDEILLEFEYDTQFLEVIQDLGQNYDLTFDLEVKGKTYAITPFVFDECLEVYDSETDDYIYHIFGTDDEEVIAQIEEQVEEMKNE